jgi:hypothetical protein
MLCHHTAHLDVDAYDDGVLARRFAPRVVRTSCGITGADARPNWREQSERALSILTSAR